VTTLSKLCWRVGLAVCVWQSLAAADTIKFRDGSVLDGTIVSETTTDVTIEVEIAGGTITKSQTVNANDIVELIRSTPEQRAVHAMELAYQRTLRYKLEPNHSYAIWYYDGVISNVFQRYLADYPLSPHTLEVTYHLHEWEAARDRAAASQAALAAAAATSTAHRVESNGGRADSPDVLSTMASWFEEYWVIFAAAAVVALWILSRVLTR